MDANDILRLRPDDTIEQISMMSKKDQMKYAMTYKIF